jgi:predicted  nucleic acid-binding Zn-ribbon protein
MPHQCLQCGKVFPSGSPEILKGCSDCGGKKFFYTEQPVSEDERLRLTEQANKDIKALIHEVLSQSGQKALRTYDSEGREVKPDKGVSTPASGWVKISPGAESVTPVSVEGEATAEGSAQAQPTVKELLQELRGKPELAIELEAKRKGEVDKEIVKTRPKKKGKVKLKRKWLNLVCMRFICQGS